MEFHGIPSTSVLFSMEFHGIFHGIPQKHLTDFFMRFFHGIPWKIPLNSMKFYMEFSMEFSMEF
jgi:hypothetical protein